MRKGSDMRGMGRVFKRGPVWWISYYRKGREYRESSDSTVKGAAVELLKKRLIRKSSIGEEKLMFEDLIELIVDDYKVNSRRSTDTTQFRIKHLREFFGLTRVIDITVGKVRAYRVYRLDEKASPSTINRELACLKRMLSLALEDDLITKAPKVPMLEGEKIREGFVDVEQFGALVARLPEYLRPFTEFLYYTGWRKGEAQKLVWKSVSLKDRVITLPRRDSKSKKPRTLPLSGRLLEVIQDQAKVRRLDCPYVFNREGNQIRDMTWAWGKACKESGNEGLLVHDLRRSAARNLRRAGVAESVAMKITGHKTASVFKRYDISDEKDVREAMERLQHGQNTDNFQKEEKRQDG